MKTLFITLAFICGLEMSVPAQVVYDPQKPGNRNPADAEQLKNGKLRTRDQDGKFKTQDGIVRTQEVIQFIKNGKMTRISQETKLSEGFVVRPNGQITKPDGTTITLQEGQMLTLKGEVVQAPRSTGTTAVRDPAKELPPRTGNLTDYGNDGPDVPGGGPEKK